MNTSLSLTHSAGVEAFGIMFELAVRHLHAQCTPELGLGKERT